jgi:hypothetical protein
VSEGGVDAAPVQSQPINLCVAEGFETVPVEIVNLDQSQALNLCMKDTSHDELPLTQSQPLDLCTRVEKECSPLPVLTPTLLNTVIPVPDMSMYYENISSPVSTK